MQHNYDKKGKLGANLSVSPKSYRDLGKISDFDRLHQLHISTDCKPGTMLDIEKAKCEDCQKGYYQDKSKQTICMKCPKGTSTKAKGSKFRSQCILWY